MQLDFNILWIDDNDIWRKAMVTKIRRCVEECGFVPNITEDADGTIILKDAFNVGLYDLIFMDYDLKNSSQYTGVDIIKNIRNNKVYSNIIFYSSKTNDLPDKVKENDIQNTYIFEREMFREENISSILDIIEFTLNRANSLNIMRGIVMDELANFDNEILEIIKQVKFDDKWNKIYDLITKGWQRYCKGIIKSDKTLEETFKTCELIRNKFDKESLKKDIFDENKSSAVFPSALRACFLNTLINEKNIMSKFSNDFKSNFHSEIIKKRNKLGHCSKIEECTNEDFLQIRKNIIKHRKNICEIKKLLCS